MHVNNKHSLSVGRIMRLRKQIIVGARNYHKYLVNKVFKLVCEDGTEVDIRFYISDFKHMTGLYSNLDDRNFYQKCFSGTIGIGNIDVRQKYNWNTLRIKGDYIEKIHELLYKDGKETLLLESLITNTYVFPYTVINNSNNMCVGFVSNMNKARSLRKASSSVNSLSKKSIIAIFAKSPGSVKYDELVYILNLLNVYKKNEMLLNQLSNSLQIKFLKIITKPTDQ